MASSVAVRTEPAERVGVARGLSLRVAAIIAGAITLSIFLLRTAWVAEDAYISFRVIDNLLHGYGLRWNIAERVQVYTDPLFVFLLTIPTWISGNVYLSAVFVSFVLSIAAYYLIVRGAEVAGILIATTALLFSKSFMDFSISGLENPATHLAIAGFLYFYWRGRDPFRLSLMAALAATNRMDTVLFFAPALAAVYWENGWRVWRRVLLGWSPFLTWSAFSLFYYGFLLPNTAYAKLHTGIPSRDLLYQGTLYYLNAARNDSVTIVVIAAGLVVAFLVREWWLAAGVLLNLVYIVRVGGDFMSARFFSGALIVAVAVIARYWKLRPVFTVAAMVALAGIGMSIPYPTVTSARADYGRPWPVGEDGIADERAFYYPTCGLLQYRSGIPWPSISWVQTALQFQKDGMPVRSVGNIGIIGYFVGPTIHILDPMALGDAFLARLPIRKGPWRPGHYWRDIPKGYRASLNSGKNEVVDPQLHEYYNHLRPLIAGNLFSASRVKDILLMNVGYYDYLLPKEIGGANK